MAIISISSSHASCASRLWRVDDANDDDDAKFLGCMIVREITVTGVGYYRDCKLEEYWNEAKEQSSKWNLGPSG